MRAIEEENQEAMFVILSDVWLDLPRVNFKVSVRFNFIVCQIMSKAARGA